MKIKVIGEHNFFLFQDIVYYFIKTLKHEWWFPLQSIHKSEDYSKHSSLYDIYKSWYELLFKKIKTFELNEYGKRIIEQMIPWMVSTNIAITKAQKERGREGIPSWEIEYSQKYKPYFLIEFDLIADTYIIHIDGEVLNIFNEALFFRKSLKNFNKEDFVNVLKRYYVFDETIIDKEIEVVCNHYRFSNDNIIVFDNYEILEE